MREQIHPTRYPELGYANHAPGLWRIVDMSTGCAIGPQYATKAELLADLDRYARVFGAAAGQALPFPLQAYRDAPSGEGALAAEWRDKPHRLIYDLCNALERTGFSI